MMRCGPRGGAAGSVGGAGDPDFVWLVTEDTQDSPPGRRDDADERHDEEHPDDPRERRPGGDRHEHDRRVEVDGLAVDDRGDDVALDDVEHDREDRHDRDVLRAPDGDRHEEGDAGRDEAPDVRDEPAEERQDGQRQRERQAEHDHDQELRRRRRRSRSRRSRSCTHRGHRRHACRPRRHRSAAMAPSRVIRAAQARLPSRRK